MKYHPKKDPLTYVSLVILAGSLLIAFCNIIQGEGDGCPKNSRYKQISQSKGKIGQEYKLECHDKLLQYVPDLTAKCERKNGSAQWRFLHSKVAFDEGCIRSNLPFESTLGIFKPDKLPYRKDKEYELKCDRMAGFDGSTVHLRYELIENKEKKRTLRWSYARDSKRCQPITCLPVLQDILVINKTVDDLHESYAKRIINDAIPMTRYLSPLGYTASVQEPVDTICEPFSRYPNNSMAVHCEKSETNETLRFGWNEGTGTCEFGCSSSVPAGVLLNPPEDSFSPAPEHKYPVECKTEDGYLPSEANKRIEIRCVGSHGEYIDWEYMDPKVICKKAGKELDNASKTEIEENRRNCGEFKFSPDSKLKNLKPTKGEYSIMAKNFKKLECIDETYVIKERMKYLKIFCGYSLNTPLPLIRSMWQVKGIKGRMLLAQLKTHLNCVPKRDDGKDKEKEDNGDQEKKPNKSSAATPVVWMILFLVIMAL